MNYQEFRDLWHAALQAARLPIPYPSGATERINLRDMSRSYELILHGGPHPEEALIDFAGRIFKAFTAFENHLAWLVGGKPQ